MPTVNQLQQSFINQALKVEQSKSGKKDAPSFGDTLTEMVGKVNELQDVAGNAIKDFVAGKDIQLHQVMAAGEEADISFKFLLEIRNKLLEAYQELSRTQV